MDCTIVQNVRHGGQNNNNCCQNATGLMSPMGNTERNLSTHVDINARQSITSANSLETGMVVTREFLLNFSKWGG